MTTGGVEFTTSILQEQVLGPLLLFGPGQAPAGWPIAPPSSPLTNADADTLPARYSPTAPRDILVSQMAGLPQIAELELSPVIALPHGAQALDAREPHQAAEPD